MKTNVVCLLALALGLNYGLQAQTSQRPGPVVLDNGKVRLTMNLMGSAFPEFVLKSKEVNPLSWKLTVEQMPKNNQKAGVAFEGHFLCMGRWGGPSAAEQAAGIPHNGEVNTDAWQVVEPLRTDGEGQRIVTEHVAKLERLRTRRDIFMPADGQSFSVREVVSNEAPLGRVWNMVQHVTIGAPFLKEKTLVDCNAGKGFDQRADINKLDVENFMWPNAILKSGQKVDLRRRQKIDSYCTTHLLVKEGGDWGWVTASDPVSGLLIGYLFRKADYPWINLWHENKDGKPWAHGLEFGTTGMGRAYKELLENNSKFQGVNSFEWLEAKQTLSKSYIAFLLEIPNNFAGVGSLSYDGQTITLTEQGRSNKKLTLKVGPMP